MKKRMIAFLAAGILAVSTLTGCTKQSDPTITTAVPETEEPKTITLHLITERISGTKGKPVSCRVRATYDERGLTQTLIREDSLNPNLSCHYVYHYNDHGHLLYRATIENGKETSSPPPHEYTYSPEGVLLSIQFDANLRREYEYDDQGRVIKVTQYMDGALNGDETCTYNDQGQLERYTNFFPGNEYAPSYSSGYEYRYDEQGRLIGMDGPNHYSCEYDEYGNLIRENDRYYTYSAPDGVIINLQDTKNPNTRYLYDELGRLVRFEEGEYYVQWTYQTIEVPVENLNMSIQFYNSVNEWPGMECYYDKIFNYLIPTSDVIGYP